jgi:hypothetical protein
MLNGNRKEILKSVKLETFFAVKKYERVGIIPAPFFAIANGWRILSQYNIYEHVCT